MAEPFSPALRADERRGAGGGAERSVEEVLQRLVDERARARATRATRRSGSPTARAASRSSSPRAWSDELIESLGPLPATARAARRDARGRRLVPHRATSRPTRAFAAGGRAAIPTCARSSACRSARASEVIGAFYLTEKDRGADVHGRRPGADRAAGRARRDRDHERAPVRAQPRALDRSTERNRLALELHDVDLAEALRLVAHRRGRGRAARPSTPRRRASRSTRLGQLAQEALEELRSLILELRPPELERDGLCGALRKHVEVLRRRAARRPRVDARARRPCRRPTPARDRELLRIAQEALQNAIQHARADAIVRAARGGTTAGCVLEVERRRRRLRPAGAPSVRSRRLGLTSMEERARAARRRARDRSAPARARPCGWRRRLPDAIRVLSSTTTRSCARGCARSCALQDGIDVVGEAGDGEEARRRRPRRLAPDVVLMDLVMPRLDGVGAMQQLRAAASRRRA